MLPECIRVVYIQFALILSNGHGVIACLSTEHGEIFVAWKNATKPTRVGAIISFGITYHFTFSVDGSIAGFHHNLGLSITIEVVDHKLSVMCSGTNIPT